MLDKLTPKHKNFIIIATMLVLIIIFYVAVAQPIFSKNHNLQNKINNELKLSTYLQKSSYKLSSNQIFSKLKGVAAKNIINSNFRNIKSSIIIKNKKITLIAKSQNFNKIIRNINNLKNKYGIVVVKANITKVISGLVDVDLTFKHP